MVDERTRKLGATSLAGIVMILVGMFTMALAGLGVSVAGATKPDPEHKITLCHRTGSRSNPYVTISPDVASVLNGHGHDGHNGPVFSADLPKHTKWGDIIPPFDYGPGEQYAGKNWDSAGQAIWNNGCNVPGTTTTTCARTSTTTTTSTTQPGDTNGSSTTTTSTTTGPGDTTTTSTTTGPGDSTTTSSSTPGHDTTTSTTGPVGNIVSQGGPGTPIAAVGGISTGAGSGTLPRTGSPMMILMSAGLALVASGIGLVVRRRRWAR